MNGRQATEAVSFAVDIEASVSERALKACSRKTRAGVLTF